LPVNALVKLLFLKSNYLHNAQVPTTKSKTEITSEPSKNAL